MSFVEAAWLGLGLAAGGAALMGVFVAGVFYWYHHPRDPALKPRD